jgi:hypothetical protein
MSKTLEATPLVRITPRGKVSMLLSSANKAAITSLLEGYLQHNAWCLRTRLDGLHYYDKIRYATVSELFTKHYTTLHLVLDQSRIILTRVHALELCHILSTHTDLGHTNPELGNLYMQLHQKLS